ncbi:MAG: hypothetical protein LQ346_002990 [Caloplaca aetnensis]|nr:MAG: hypothetical protein LQ346_002990 [Caloplaca aetnensis]
MGSIEVAQPRDRETLQVRKRFKTSELPLNATQRSDIDGLLHTLKKKGHYDTVRKNVWSQFIESDAKNFFKDRLTELADAEIDRDPSLLSRDRGKAATLMQGAVDRSDVYKTVEISLDRLISAHLNHVIEAGREIRKAEIGEEAAAEEERRGAITDEEYAKDAAIRREARERQREQDENRKRREKEKERLRAEAMKKEAELDKLRRADERRRERIAREEQLQAERKKREDEDAERRRRDDENREEKVGRDERSRPPKGEPSPMPRSIERVQTAGKESSRSPLQLKEEDTIAASVTVPEIDMQAIEAAALEELVRDAREAAKSGNHRLSSVPEADLLSRASSMLRSIATALLLTLIEVKITTKLVELKMGIVIGPKQLLVKILKPISMNAMDWERVGTAIGKIVRTPTRENPKGTAIAKTRMTGMAAADTTMAIATRRHIKLRTAVARRAMDTRMETVTGFRAGTKKTTSVINIARAGNVAMAGQDRHTEALIPNPATRNPNTLEVSIGRKVRWRSIAMYLMAAHTRRRTIRTGTGSVIVDPMSEVSATGFVMPPRWRRGKGIEMQPREGRGIEIETEIGIETEEGMEGKTGGTESAVTIEMSTGVGMTKGTETETETAVKRAGDTRGKGEMIATGIGATRGKGETTTPGIEYGIRTEGTTDTSVVIEEKGTWRSIDMSLQEGIA